MWLARLWQEIIKVCQSGIKWSNRKMEVKRLGNIYGENKGTGFAGNVWDSDGICPTITTMQGGGREPMIVEDKAIRMVRTEEGKALRKDYETGTIHHGFNEHREMELRLDGLSNTLSTVQKDNYICEKSNVAMRGRSPENMSDRTPGIHLEQRLEPNSQGICDTLTSVQKDNLVMETVRIRQATKEGYIECKIEDVADLSYPGSTTRRGRVQDGGDACPTITATETGVCRIDTCYRIRKLTPKECWRLMAFTDEDFHKAEAVNSDSQLYKQAGNSIVVSVLEAIFGQLLADNQKSR